MCAGLHEMDPLRATALVQSTLQLIVDDGTTDTPVAVTGDVDATWEHAYGDGVCIGVKTVDEANRWAADVGCADISTGHGIACRAGAGVDAGMEAGTGTRTWAVRGVGTVFRVGTGGDIGADLGAGDGVETAGTGA